MTARRPDPKRTDRLLHEADGEFDLHEWKEKMEALPDMRMAKVMRLRRAINSDSYDEDAVIEKMINDVHNDVGVLCRQDPADS